MITYDDREFPEYRCHKVVKAAVIRSILSDLNPMKIKLVVQGEGCEGIREVVFPEGQIKKHSPEVGWFVVFYQDGYVSFSPPEVFVEGYDLLEKEPEDE